MEEACKEHKLNNLLQEKTLTSDFCCSSSFCRWTRPRRWDLYT